EYIPISVYGIYTYLCTQPTEAFLHKTFPFKPQTGITEGTKRKQHSNR
ncbi:unnamed protein product, partial [Allacma fusca]